jgi:hypothetical protein
MPLPQQIAVRYAEEDAGYVSTRPVVNQTFRLSELTDMVVSVVGKDAARVQQIFRGGTVLYNGYHYWWDSLSADLAEIESLVAAFPDDDPSRPFDAGKVTAIVFEAGGGTQRNLTEIARSDAQQKRLFAKTSPWHVLLQVGTADAPRYEKYSYPRRADIYRLTLPFDRAQQILAAMLDAAPRGLRHRWSTLRPPAALTFVCPR